MSPDEFTHICETIYGKQWQSALSKELVREPRTIRRWKSGESPIPKKVVDWLRSKHVKSTT